MLVCDHCGQPTELKDFGQFTAEAKICSGCCRKARLANAELAKKPVEVESTAYDLFHNAAEDSPPSDDHEFGEGI
jgi:hypothetical protein